MAKLLKFDDSLEAIRKGVFTLTKAVKATLGPKGRNVVINKKFGKIESTKDGVTVAREIVLKDKFENMGAQIVKEAAEKTASTAGDGTTTAIVIANAMYQEGVKAVTAGANPMAIKKGIDAAVQVIEQELLKMAIPIKTSDKIEQIATISANNDAEIGKLIGEAMSKVGADGTITVADAKGLDTYIDYVEGLQIDKGFLSPYFITNAETMSVEFSNAWILITDKKIGSAKEIVPLLEKVNSAGNRPLLIIADDVDSEALATLVVNKTKGGDATLRHQGTLIWRSQKSASRRSCSAHRRTCCILRNGP